MKKQFVMLSIILLFSNLFALEIPESLYGIWEGNDRFVFFEKSETDQPQIVILLKEYYGWYYDRAVEPAEYSEKEPRTRNSATARKSEQVYIQINPVSKNTVENCFEVELNYSKTQKNIIPVCVLNDNIFLNYYIQDSEDNNFYRGVVKTQGFKVSPQYIAQNLSCIYFTEEGNYFDIRYWLSDMDYSDEKVNLKFDSNTYLVDKHIFSCGNNYSCVSGRSKNIRNVVNPFTVEEGKFISNETKSLLITDNEPYLTKLAGKETFEDLIEIVRKGNSRRKPDPAPIFPPSDLNWHWDLIDALESNNSLIQAVRQRQKAFGPRAKDIK